MKFLKHLIQKMIDGLKRELMEEVGIKVIDYQLFDADSVFFDWQVKEDVFVKVHHLLLLLF